MDKYTLYCGTCNKKFFLETNDLDEVRNSICKFCKGNDIFIQDVDYEVEPDRTPIKTGSRGCGTSGRFI